MRTLNRSACDIAIRLSSAKGGTVHGATDITGFGLLGHAREMALASNVMIEIDSSQIEALPGAMESIRKGAVPAGLKNNQEFVSCSVSFGGSVSSEMQTLLYDPQTSGGLLISISVAQSEELLDALVADRIPARIIGRVRDRLQETGESPIKVI
jgi:selenide,water dikinase